MLFRSNAEIQGIKPYFKTCAVSKDVTFLMDENASKDQLKDSILAIKRGKTDEQPKIIHFSGHANKDFLLLSENNAVGAGSLLNLLRGIKNLKLVFMNACCTQALKDFLFNQPDIEVEAFYAFTRLAKGLEKGNFLL